MIIILLLIFGLISRLWFFWRPIFSGDESLHVLKAVSVDRGLFDLIRGNQINIALTNIIDPILKHNHPPLEFLVLTLSAPLHPQELFARLNYIIINFYLLS